QLHVADGDGHSLLVSCGAAIELTEIALRAHGWRITSTLLPDPNDPDLLSRMDLVLTSEPDRIAQAKLAAAGRRRSDRRVFAPALVSSEETERLRSSAHAAGVYAHFPVRADEGLDLAVAISKADRYEHADPAYLAEMARWVHTGDSVTDGIPNSAVPLVDPEHPRHTDIPLRDFEIGVPGGQLTSAGADERPLIAVIFTEADGPREQVRAGQAMMRLMIQAELDGIATCPLSQSVDLLSFRSELRALMGWTGFPQMMLRLGYKPTTVPAPLTKRRPIAEVLTVTP
ncbi:hypothetical protein, partial [Jatrophihabitans sp.]|uniref:Acg family FMN-binding oxidoreductase n=1 Tax=Jatrophihabitans sp. TaxID=1932789 RepID=UPI0030C6D664|nr:nitroreductase [Jatrophihabitans sp.]